MEAQSVDTEYIILENIYDSSSRELSLRQRDLAHMAGTSLGMTNSILKRLAQKGWISVKKLNSRNIRYIITPEGINEVVRRGYRYFKRTIRNVVYYKESLDELIHRASRKNIGAVLLVGVSDLDFILEHLCHRYGLSFLEAVDPETAFQALGEHTLVIFAENISDWGPVGPGREKLPGEKFPGAFYLSRMVMKKKNEDAP